MTRLSAFSLQMLIWSLPEDEGAWIRFEGSYKQTRSRPNSNAGDEVLEWRSEMTISSLGRENAALSEGSDETPCRWVEFKTGDPDPAKWQDVIERKKADGSWERATVLHSEFAGKSDTLEFMQAEKK